jgi:NAD+ kinase
MNVGIVGSPRYPDIRGVLTRVAETGRSVGFEFFTHQDLDGLWPSSVPILQQDTDIDLLISLGGDGTLLRGVRALPSHTVPILGVNFGHVGFLTTAGPDDLEDAFRAVVDNEYEVEKRDTIVSEVMGADGSARPGDRALNDIVLHHQGLSKVVQLQVSLDGYELGPYSADGMVLATATGSTAYSLSSGGPIMTPEVDALVITPIAAHSLAVRPVVVPGSSVVGVKIVGRLKGRVAISYDGKPLSQLEPGEEIVVRRSDKPVNLIRLKGEDFFSRMRQKLHWGDLSGRYTT